MSLDTLSKVNHWHTCSSLSHKSLNTVLFYHGKDIHVLTMYEPSGRMHSKEDFLEFFHGLNLVHSSLRFTMEISYISIQFLDWTISKGFSLLWTGLLSTRIFFKHTNTFSYLHGCSYISRHVLKGIAVGWDGTDPFATHPVQDILEWSRESL